MIRLIHAVRPAGWEDDFPGEANLREMFTSPVIQNAARLWLDDSGGLRAFAFVDPYHNIWFEGAALEQIEGQMFEWGAAVLARDCAAEPDGLTLDTNCREENAARRAMLERNGFQVQPVRTLFLERTLTGDLPPHRLPDGFKLQVLSAEKDVDAFHRLHSEAFGNDLLSREEAEAILRGEGEMWVVPLAAAAPDGRLAGYCVCSIDLQENRRHHRKRGYTDPVAVHPAFRKHGLARALLAEGLKALRSQGALEAGLGTSSENAAMLAAAQAAGFAVTSAKVWYSKNVT